MARRRVYVWNMGVSYRGLSWITLCALLLVGMGMSIFWLQRQSTVDALSVSDFKPGNIMSDSVFFDGGRMNESSVQNFLNAKMPSCDTWGTKPHSSGQSRAQYGASQGNPAPYTCLKDYRQNTPSMLAESGLCSAYSGGSNQSAAKIIADVGAACGINQQVLIVLLHKEQGLVTDEWPWTVQYTKATGFSCPDTAPCDPSFGGFFYQVYYAARQFKKYARDQTGYKAYRNNYVQYNPNASCGGTNVYIENQATAGLYTYTPYQPNPATLAWKLGNGPSVSSSYPGCGAFGNVNFFIYFSNWFGPTQAGSFLLRTPENATVYLVTDTHKYPIADINILGALPFGPVGFVSQSYLDGKQTGQVMQRIIRDSRGTVYYFDSSIKLAFPSCALVEDYGYSCGDSVLLNDVQVGSFATGPQMTRFYRTTSGKNFYIQGGQKREIFDTQSLTNVGLSGSFNVLTESPLGNLAYGAPITRAGVIAQQRGQNVRFALTGSAKRPVGHELWDQTRLKALPAGQLDPQSLNQITTGAAITPLFYDSVTQKPYVLGSDGRHLINNSSTQWGAAGAAVLESAIQSQLPIVGNADVSLVKSHSNGTVYALDAGKKRVLSSWDDLLRVDQSATILSLPDSVVGALSSGAPVMSQGTLVKSPDNGTVYYVDGMNTIIPLTTFAISDELGVKTLKVYPKSTVDAYTKHSQTLRSVVTCGGATHWGLGGKLYNPAGSPISSVAGVIPLALEACPAAVSGLGPSLFWTSSYGTIYRIVNGVKYPISGYNAYVQLGGDGSNTIRVGDISLGLLPTGATL